MKIVYKARLDTNDIQNVINQIDYYKHALERDVQRFIDKLATEGITCAMHTNMTFGNYISFHKTMMVNGHYTEAQIVMHADSMMFSEWKQEDGSVKTAEVNPILMEEFGSGFKTAEIHAQRSNAFSGHTLGGQGTFPNQTHANDSNGWWYKDLNDEWHHVYGTKPSMPLSNAIMEMYLKVKQVEKDVFG